MEIFKDYLGDLFFKFICYNGSEKMVEKVLLEHPESFNSNGLIVNNNIDAEFFEKYPQLIEEIGPSIYYKLNIEQIQKIVKNRELDSNDWFNISANRNLPLEFLESYIKKLDISTLNFRSNNLEFFERNPHLIVWTNFCVNKNIPFEFAQKFAAGRTLIYHHAAPLDYLETCLESYPNDIDWWDIGLKKSLTPEFFEKHFSKLSWTSLGLNQSLSYKFYEKHIYMFEISKICINPNIPHFFFKKHFFHVYNCDSLLHNPNIPLKFYIKHYDHPKIVYNNEFTRQFFLINRTESFSLLKIDF